MNAHDALGLALPACVCGVSPHDAQYHAQVGTQAPPFFGREERRDALKFFSKEERKY
jgi:hypothetical protein